MKSTFSFFVQPDLSVCLWFSDVSGMFWKWQDLTEKTQPHTPINKHTHTHTQTDSNQKHTFHMFHTWDYNQKYII